MTVYLTFVGAAAVTFLLRSTMTWMTPSGVPSDRLGVNSWIVLVTPAVLAAMVASALLVDHGALARPDGAEILAVGAAVVAVRRTRNVSMALFVGLPVFWLIGLLGPSCLATG